MPSQQWDYVVIGAGSAGCAVTAELVNSGRSVLLLEAGRRDSSLFIKVPAGQIRAVAKYDWGYRAEPDVTRNSIVESWPRGRVLGGSSSVNGTLYTRGIGSDYDGWGLTGWTWNDVLPIFRDFEDSDQPGPSRGHGGALAIRTVRRPHVLTKAFVEAAEVTGLTLLSDYNAENQEGIGLAQLSQRRGLRCSAADAFIRPIVRKNNLSIIMNGLVTAIEFDGKRAVAVSFEVGGSTQRALARDVVLCAGVINSPQLLMLSGIGNARELKEKEVAVVHDLPGVGAHLQDQPLVSPLYRTKIPSYNLTQGLGQKLSYALRFLLCGEGPVSNIFEAAAFLRSGPEVSSPDLQIIFSALGYGKESDGKYFIEDTSSVMVHVMLSYPESKGRIALRSKDPRDAPVIDCPLLESHKDVSKLIAGLKGIRRIVQAPPFRELVLREVLPGEYATSDVSLEEYVRKHASTSFHPIGTCRMGVGPEAVVGPDLRVHGIENLWVADASVIPKHPSANPNAVCIMIGKKLGKHLVSSRRS
jgi:choline dehydrogenase-like flavoprotein